MLSVWLLMLGLMVSVHCFLCLCRLKALVATRILSVTTVSEMTYNVPGVEPTVCVWWFTWGVAVGVCTGDICPGGFIPSGALQPTQNLGWMGHNAFGRKWPHQ